MSLHSLPAMFMRGGTSKALMFRASDLPADRAQWDAIFLSAMGSPDPNGRQLNGMGGGTTSLSKVCVVGSSSRSDADVDYTFAQVEVDRARVDYGINCGNMSSAVGPFAVLRGMVPASDGEARVRIFNTNTQKVIVATFGVRNGVPLEEGHLEIPGVAGSGAPIRLDFLEPGGATTGKLLPSGAEVQWLEVPGVGRVEASLVDAANACVFVAAPSLGLAGNELPADIEGDPALLERIAAVRAAGSVAMGIAATAAEAREKKVAPFFALVSPPQQSKTLSGQALPASAVDLTVRVIASGQAHRALPLTISLCTAVAARIPGTLAGRAMVQLDTAGGVKRAGDQPLRLGMPSGVLTVDALVEKRTSGWHAERGSFYRTARRLFDGCTFYSKE
ncbi:MAG TPA: PrpF domain-containing protein [Burkholderiales bacterium]|nr:PrpF domain-containing protein [Burkholderiales bacterium]